MNILGKGLAESMCQLLVLFICSSEDFRIGDHDLAQRGRLKRELQEEESRESKEGE